MFHLFRGFSGLVTKVYVRNHVRGIWHLTGKKSELVGERFGMLTVTEDSGQRKGSSILYRCQCDCGGKILAIRHELVGGMVRDCGCRPKSEKKSVEDLIGRRFGMLTVTEDSGKRSGSGVILWRCSCDCGGEILATRQQLESGNIRSCGCIPKQNASKRVAEDLTGQQFGKLTVLRRSENNNHGRACWICRCACGNEVTVPAMRLKSGHTRSCGCLRKAPSHRAIDLTGQRFGRLTVIGRAQKEPNKLLWHCRCDCGNEVDVCGASLIRGLTLSCGCWKREQSAKLHEHMHYQDNTCLERLQRVQTDARENKAGFRGLFLTKSGLYRVVISFQGKQYNLGYYHSFEEAVKVRLEAEETFQLGYMEACRQYEEKAHRDPSWAEENPFYYHVSRVNGKFCVNMVEI